MASPTGQPPLYQLRDVRKTKERGGARFVLEVPDFFLQPGEVVAIVGRSGCGKSTLLDLLALISPADRAGEFSITIDTATFSVPTLTAAQTAALRRQHFGYVLQRGGLLSSLNSRSNVTLPRILGGLPSAANEVDQMFETLGITGQRGKKPVHLSGGQRQRVAIARALCHRPRIILADEPSGSVDVNTANIIGATLKEATHDQKAGVVLVTHDLDLADAYADRFYDFDLNEKSSTELHSTLRPRL